MRMNQNIYNDKPAKGTVIAILSEEEVKAFQVTGRRLEAEERFLANPNCTSTASYEEAYEASIELWRQLHKKHSIPYVWKSRVDWTTGAFIIED